MAVPFDFDDDPGAGPRRRRPGIVVNATVFPAAAVAVSSWLSPPIVPASPAGG